MPFPPTLPANSSGPRYTPSPVAEFLPRWLTQQTQNDIYARGAQQFAPQKMLAKFQGGRNVDPGSPMIQSKMARTAALGRAELARGGAETGLQDALQRSQFGLKHSIAANQDVMQGARNQALRDQIYRQGQQQQLNPMLSLLGGLFSH